jgi:hypothetical protein
VAARVRVVAIVRDEEDYHTALPHLVDQTQNRCRLTEPESVPTNGLPLRTRAMPRLKYFLRS